MTEYWVSKKQYYCKYCSIYIRDDAPSRKQHETGLKHIGNVERYIRDLYKTGSMAKKEKAEEAAEMARIEAAAAAAYANDKASGSASPSTSKPSILSSLPSSSSAAAGSSKPKAVKPTDKYSNYSTAEQLGYKEEKTDYEIQQEIKNQIGQPSAWETVTLPDQQAAKEQEQGEKKKWPGEHEEDENENWKFEYNKTANKHKRDPYEDDWDPSSIKSLKVKKKEEKIISDPKKEKEEMDKLGLNRDNWTGRLELNPVSSSTDNAGKDKEGLEYVQGNGWIKKDEDELQDNTVVSGKDKESNQDGTDIKPVVEGVNQEDQSVRTESGATQVVESKPAVGESVGGGSVFKKRRPPPSSRKK
ncbi:hypothetical protein L486_05681 [Kwoniella mangroviensis CBS 10435]|uniref:Matrin-type domain-containing protein n=1 Tax=Kwoniella mangroviensis CBS 10435 TaxID=1331196 RepID=A0A1B9IMJ8_9TREE|nr:uncharacterized protein I203_07329 [Kwoniella mangroviensis CBS 8507]OCF56826.1 hypothetical protein L486_05681 [Kwoniella mangroviensis CBS 10435]OCF63631.1 hypothetical protein I203_07329 [Kwoniella mangroviensis CBS 8507]